MISFGNTNDYLLSLIININIILIIRDNSVQYNCNDILKLLSLLWLEVEIYCHELYKVIII